MHKEDETRRLAHQTLMQAEWLDTHATSRLSKHQHKLESAIRDIKKWMLKIIGTYTSDDIPEESSVEVVESLVQAVQIPQDTECARLCGDAEENSEAHPTTYSEHD